ncbi:hypothetical protein STEG23_006536 [Scotinomys teguina]
MCRLSWFLDVGGWGKAAVVGLYFIFPGICTLSLGPVQKVLSCANEFKGIVYFLFYQSLNIDILDQDSSCDRKGDSVPDFHEKQSRKPPKTIFHW